MTDAEHFSSDTPLHGSGRGGGEEEAALRKYFCLGPDENTITRHRFTGPEMVASLGLTSQELEIIFSALDVDCDGVITLDELLEQWPEGGGDLGAGADDTGDFEEAGATHDESLDSSPLVAEPCGDPRLCLEDSDSQNNALQVLKDLADDPHAIETLFRAAAEDRGSARDGGVEYNKTRRRSSLLLHILDSRASPVPQLASTPSSTFLQSPTDAATGSSQSITSQQMVSASSSVSSPTTASTSAPPRILSPLSPRRLVDVFPPTPKTTADTTDSESIPHEISFSISSPPTSPRSPTASTPSHKAVKCDHSCVHPSKLTLTDLMASSLQDITSDHSPVSTGGCKDNHRHVRRKIRPGSSITDPKSPLVADTSLHVPVPTQTNQNQSLDTSFSGDSFSSITSPSDVLSPSSADDGTGPRRGLLRPPTESSRSSRWSAHQYSAIDGTTPTIRKFRAKSPRPEKAGSLKMFPLRGDSVTQPIDLELARLSKSRFVILQISIS